VASRSFDDLQQSCRAALVALNVLGTRNFVVVLDETVWFPQWEIVCGLRQDSAMGYIGGYKSTDEDVSYIPSPAEEDSMPQEKLAKMSVHYVISRADSNRHVYQVDCLPRKPKPKGSTETMAGAKITMMEYGFLWKVSTWCNSDLPPLSGAWDGGSSNTSVNALFLGLLPKAQMHVPFFSQCTKKPLPNIPMWTYQALFYGEHFLSGCNDNRHIMKRFGSHLCSGARMIRWGAFIVSLTPLVNGGLSLRALSGDDPQSDVDGARRMNAAYVQDCWSSLSCIVPQFVSSLLTSAWTASAAFSLREAVSNALMAYYLLCIQTSQTMKENKKGWSKHWLPAQNLRALMDLAGHIVLASVHWPQQEPWMPSAREESLIEKFFGQVKSYQHGDNTMKDGIYGAHMVHAKQYAKCAMWEDFQSRRETPVSQEELTLIAKRSLDNAVTFHSWISKGLTCEQIHHDVKEWWGAFGHDFLKKRFRSGDAEHAGDMPLEMDEEED
ncbi:unnamed protein product, partial [Durusdinium trenchii]